MGIVDFFRKEKRKRVEDQPKFELMEVAPNVTEMVIPPVHVEKFMNIDLETPQKIFPPRKRESVLSLEWTRDEISSSWVPPGVNVTKLPPRMKAPPVQMKAPQIKTPLKIPIKINSLTNVPSSNDAKFVFMGYSKIDRFPIYNYVGDEPALDLKNYDFEELYMNVPQVNFKK